MGTVYHSGLPYGVGAYAATATAAPFPSYLNATAAANTPSNTTANTAANTAAASASSFSSSVSASASASASDSKAASSALLDIASYPSSSSVSASSSFASSASSLSTAPSTSGSAFGSLDSYKVHSQSQPRSSYTHIPISSSSSSSTPPTTTSLSASSSSASLASALEPPAAAAAEDEQPKLATAAAPATAPLAPPVLPSTAVDSASTMYAIGSGSLRTHEHQQQHQQLQQHQQQQQQQQASTNDHLHHHQQSQQHSSDLASSLMHPPFQSAADPQPSSSSFSSAIATVAANTTAAAMSTASAAPAANSSSAEPKKTGLELHSMALPACISPNGGSLSDFVAQMTCFMIQEPWKIVADACQYTSGSPLPRQRLVPEAIAKPELLKWTQNILATTQVTQNVVLLALLLIYRLKRSNQHLKGHYGSAYRLLTIALMLGNKFLDDNTYTNKTWADVSSISVHEIHHMEVEFLSNMRYSLFVREQQWSAWLKNMANMKAYYDEAARRISSPDPSVLMAAQTYLPPQPLHAHSSHSPSRLSTAYIPSSSGQSHAQLPHALTNASASVNAAESMVYHPELSPSLSAGGLSRKRNYPEHDPQSDARKSRRMSPSRTLSTSPSGQMCIPHTANVPLPLGSSVAPMDPINYASAANPPASRDSRRLTLPHLTVNTNTNPMAAAPVPQPQSAFVATTVPSSSNNNNNNNNNNNQPVFGTLAARTVSSSLPPLASGSRSVVGNSVVNPHTGSSYGGVPPQNLMAMSISQPPVSSHLSQSAAPAYLPPSTTQLSSTGYVTPTKRHSPGTLGRYGFSPHGTNPDIFMNHQGRIPSHSQNSGFAHSHNMATSMPRSPLSPSVQSATLRSAVPHSHPHGVSVSTPLDQTPGAGHQRSPYPTLSPIAYLNDRSSPYRPVRTVNTLMYPPGSTSLSEYHLTPQAITPNSMHWHRVGRPNDIRSGIVPEYRHM
ncbi:Cyclin [Ceratocystis platani]|uniref:Cyclin n=1 Tax=Ceratocystis fimbriata f. sp. platani TaxID=88771 RepID=A0A0F8B2G3_CERFI|nr:Cyclin [Ceratocystis platani]